MRRGAQDGAQLLAVKQEVLRADAGRLEGWSREVVDSEDPARTMAG